MSEEIKEYSRILRLSDPGLGIGDLDLSGYFAGSFGD